MKPARLHTSARSAICPSKSPVFWNDQKTRLFSFLLVELVRLVTLVLLTYYRIFRKFQQQLFCASILEGNSGFGILAATLNLDDRADTKALMLNDIALFETNVANSRLGSRRFSANWNKTRFHICHKLRSHRAWILHRTGIASTTSETSLTRATSMTGDASP